MDAWNEALGIARRRQLGMCLVEQSKKGGANRFIKKGAYVETYTDRDLSGEDGHLPSSAMSFSLRPRWGLRGTSSHQKVGMVFETDILYVTSPSP